ncbi:hypothetical protein STEG23_016827, partial [Scotinomys teguina]
QHYDFIIEHNDVTVKYIEYDVTVQYFDVIMHYEDVLMQCYGAMVPYYDVSFMLAHSLWDYQLLIDISGYVSFSVVLQDADAFHISDMKLLKQFELENNFSKSRGFCKEPIILPMNKTESNNCPNVNEN